VSLDEITHKAHRDHLCAFCGMTVQKNERYVRAQSPGGAQAKKAFHIGCYRGLLPGAAESEKGSRGK